MRKYVILVLVLFMLPISFVNAEEEIKVLSLDTDKVQVSYEKDVFYYSSGSKFGVFFNNLYVNGTYSYCLNFDDKIENTSDHLESDPLNQYSEEEWRKYSLYAMYANQKYEETKDRRYRFAAQALIHEATFPKNKKMLFYDYSTSARSEFDVDTYKAELVSLYNTHILNPDISFDGVDFKVGQSYKFEDKNKVISKYIIESKTDNIDVKIDGNFVEVQVLSSGEASFSLATDDNAKDGDIVLWTSNKYQDLITVSSYNPAKVDYTLKSTDNFGSLNVRKLDSETKELLSGAVFELYKLEGADYKLLNEFVVDGETTIDQLHLGSYKIAEKTAPNGYSSTNKEFEFIISEDDQLVVIDVENSKILPKTGLVNGYFATLSTLLVGLFITRHYYGKKRSFKR